jgi:hypothetical protein
MLKQGLGFAPMFLMVTIYVVRGFSRSLQSRSSPPIKWGGLR